MFNNFIVSTAIIANILGLTLPQAVAEEVYLVPTVEEELTIENPTAEVEAKIQELVRSQVKVPRATTDVQPEAIDAWTAVVMDAATQKVLWQKNPGAEVPIASITKLMTALTWFELQPDDGFEHVHTFAPEQDTPDGKELNLPHGAQLQAADLLKSTLVGSDNDTALALAASTEMPLESFVGWMNVKARKIGLEHTTFADPTGLSAQNTSTALDIAQLARVAFGKDAIREAASQASHVQETVDSGFVTRVATTNKLLYDPELEVVAGKTGFIPEAGYCLVVQVRVPDTERDILVVVLGAESEHGRFDQAKLLALWAQHNHSWN